MAAKKDKKAEAPASAPAVIEPTPNGPFESPPGSQSGMFPGGESDGDGTDGTMDPGPAEAAGLANTDEMSDASAPAFIAKNGEWVPAEEASAPAVSPETVVFDDEPITEHYEIKQPVYDALAIPSMRFTDGVHLYQLDPVKSGLFLLRPIGAYHDAV